MNSIELKIVISCISISFFNILMLEAIAGLNYPKNYFVILCLSLFISIIASVFVYKVVVSPVKRLVKSARGILGWEYDFNEIENYDEAAELENLVKVITRFEENQQILNSLFTNISNVILITDNSGKIISVNPSVEKIFGYSQDEVTGKSIDELLSCQFFGLKPGEFDKNSIKYIEKENKYEIESRKKNADKFNIELEMSKISSNKKSFFGFVINDITHRKEIQANKDEFVSMINHSLRTPLTSIKASLSLLKGNVYGELPDKTAKLIDIANINAIRLGELVEDIRDIEKVESGNIILNIKKCSIAEIISETIETQKFYAEQYNVNIQLICSDKLIMVNTDINRIDQAVSNMISSAVRCTPSGKTVIVNIYKINNFVRVSVTDRGKGIPLAYQKKIFEECLPDAPEMTGIGGVGLGLKRSKLLIEKLGGTLDFETKLGEGSTFYFDLPIAVED